MTPPFMMLTPMSTVRISLISGRGIARSLLGHQARHGHHEKYGDQYSLKIHFYPKICIKHRILRYSARLKLGCVNYFTSLFSAEHELFLFGPFTTVIQGSNGTSRAQISAIIYWRTKVLSVVFGYAFQAESKCRGLSRAHS